MAENNNNGGKNTNIITKINDTISKVLGDFPPVVQTIAKIVVFGGLILLIAKAIGYIFPVIVNVLFNLLVKIVGFCILAAFLYNPCAGKAHSVRGGSASRLLVRGKTANDSR